MYYFKHFKHSNLKKGNQKQNRYKFMGGAPAASPPPPDPPLITGHHGNICPECELDGGGGGREGGQYGK